MKKKFFLGLVMCLSFCLLFSSVVAGEQDNAQVQIQQNKEQVKPEIKLFWGQGCPHCAHLKEFLADLKQAYPEFQYSDYEIYYEPENGEKFIAAVEQCEPEINPANAGVPLLVIGSKCFMGYGGVPSTGRQIESYLLEHNYITGNGIKVANQTKQKSEAIENQDQEAEIVLQDQEEKPETAASIADVSIWAWIGLGLLLVAGIGWMVFSALNKKEDIDIEE